MFYPHHINLLLVLPTGWRYGITLINTGNCSFGAGHHSCSWFAYVAQHGQPFHSPILPTPCHLTPHNSFHVSKEGFSSSPHQLHYPRCAPKFYCQLFPSPFIHQHLCYPDTVTVSTFYTFYNSTLQLLSSSLSWFDQNLLTNTIKSKFILLLPQLFLPNH